MEEITGTAARGFFRFITWCVIDLFIESVLYYTGVIIAKVVTLGRFPKAKQYEQYEFHFTLVGAVFYLMLGVLVWFLSA